MHFIHTYQGQNCLLLHHTSTRVQTADEGIRQTALLRDGSQ